LAIRCEPPFFTPFPGQACAKKMGVGELSLTFCFFLVKQKENEKLKTGN
jgi:hypothetical protein